MTNFNWSHAGTFERCRCKRRRSGPSAVQPGPRYGFRRSF